MKKIIFTTLCIGLGITTLFAQNAQEAKVSLLKVEQPCVSATYNVSENLLDQAWTEKLGTYKIKKGDKVKGGYRVYKGVNIPEISPDKIDLYVLTSGGKSDSKLTILVSKGYDNFVNSQSDSATVRGMINLLNSMDHSTLIAQIKYDIEKQVRVVEDADKNLKNQISKGNEYEKELKNLEGKIADNKVDQTDAEKKLKEEKALLEELQNKLNSVK